MIFRNFFGARQFAHELKLRGKHDWANYCKSGDKPVDIPSNPARTYKNEWKGWGDWLGTGNIGPLNRQYRSFEQAREFAQSLRLKSKTEWEKYRKSGKLLKDIPGDLSIRIEVGMDGEIGLGPGELQIKIENISRFKMPGHLFIK